MSKSLLLIGRVDTYSARQIVDSARANGLVCDAITPQDIILDGEVISYIGASALQKEVAEYDTYFFRGLGALASSMQDIARKLDAAGKLIIERRFPAAGLPEDKFVPPSEQGLYAVPLYKVVSSALEPTDLEGFQFPLVVKKLGLGSSKGAWVQKVHEHTELLVFMEKDLAASYIVQEYIPCDYDTRVMVVGGEVIGAFDRYRPEGEEFLTTARGGKREQSILTSQQISAAIEAASLQGLGIAGVDMLSHNGEIYIIEVNASPQFKVFDKKTGVSAAEKIISYLLRGDTQ